MASQLAFDRNALFEETEKMQRDSIFARVADDRIAKVNDFLSQNVLSSGDAQALKDAAASLRTKTGKEKPTVLLINATESGGGVAEMRPDTTALLRDLGFDAHWLVIDGCADFFGVTVHFHEAIQDPNFDVPINSDEIRMHQLGNIWNFEKMEEAIKKCDMLWVDDPQPIAMIPLIRAIYPDKIVVSRIHVQVNPIPSLKSYLRAIIQGELTEGRDSVLLNYIRGRLGVKKAMQMMENSYAAHAAVFHIQPFADALALDKVPVKILGPSINPLSCKNRPLPSGFVVETLKKYSILPADFDGSKPLPPIVTEISRFDPCKGPLEVIAAFIIAVSEHKDPSFRRTARLVYAGNIPTDNPSGISIFGIATRFLRNLPSSITSIEGMEDIRDRVFLLNLEDNIVDGKVVRDMIIKPTDNPFSNLTGGYLTPSQAKALEEGQPDALFSFAKADGGRVQNLSGRDINHLEVNALQTAAMVRAQFSIKEGFGLVVSEAMVKVAPPGHAHGVMVATDVGGIHSQVVQGCGFLTDFSNEEVDQSLEVYRNLKGWHEVEPARRLERESSQTVLQPLFDRFSNEACVKAFAANILTVFEMDEKKRAEMGEAGRNHIMKNFSTTGNVKNILDVFNDVIA